MKIPELKLMAYDTEMISEFGMPDPNRDPVAIISICYFEDGKKETRLLVLSDKEFQLRDDSRIVRKFLDFIKVYDPDIIFSFNGDNFDFPYLDRRAKINGLSFSIGRDESHIKITPRKGFYGSVDIIGRNNIDLYKLANRELDDVKVKSLKNVADYLEVKKLEDRVLLNPNEIYSAWFSDRHKLYKYAADDAESTMDVGLKMLPAQIHLSNLLGLPLDENVRMMRGRQMEHYFTYKAHKIGELIPFRRGEETTYEGARVLKPERGLYEFIGDIDFKCVDSETQVLTDECKWRNIGSIGVGNKILTFNIETGYTEFQEVLHTYKYEVQDISMINIRALNLNQLITQHHRVLYKDSHSDEWHERFAKDIPYMHSKIPNSFRICRTEDFPISDDLIKLHAWIITGGWKSGNSYNISQSYTKNKPNCLELDRMFESYNLPLPNKETAHFRRNGELTWHVPASLAKENIKLESCHKRIPLWMLKELSIRQLTLLFDELVRGDGHIPKGRRNSCYICAKDREARERLIALGTLLGYRTVNLRNSWYVWFTKNTHYTSIGSSKYNKRSRIINYSGTLHCVTIQNSYIVIKRNGTVSITGNSLYPTIIVKKNISPDALTEEQEDSKVNIVPELGHRFLKHPAGFLPSILTELLEARDEIKDRMKHLDRNSSEYKLLDIQQYNLKIVTNCFSADTDILTPFGVKNIKNFKVGDSVYSINPKTLDIEVSHVIDTQVFYSEYINEILDKRRDFLVTDEHRFLIRTPEQSEYSFYIVDKMRDHKSDWVLPYHKPWNGKIDECFSLWEFVDDEDIIYFKPYEKSCHRFEITKNPIFKISTGARAYRVKKSDINSPSEFEAKYKGKLYLKSFNKSRMEPWRYKLKDFMRLGGWYVSEGNLYYIIPKEDPKWKSRRGASYKIQITQSKYRDEVRELLQNMEIRFYEESKCFSFSSKYIFRALDSLFGRGSYNKFINPKLFEYDSSILKYLYDSMMLGDGGKNRYSTVSRLLAESFVILCVLLGYKARIKFEENKIWRVLIYSNDKTGRYAGKDIHRIFYNNLTYCITTDHNFTVLAGRNGKFEWTGQSAYGIYGWAASKLFKLEVAESITAWGRDYISKAIEIAEREGFDVIFGDTDSLFIKKEEISSLDKLKIEANNLTSIIRRELEIDIKPDEYFKSILFTGAKKRYSAINEFDERVDRGLEVRRGDWALISKEVQSTILDIILREHDINKAISYTKNIIKDLKNGNIPLEKLTISKTMTMLPEDYTNTQAHVIAAQRALTSPYQIKYAVGSKVPYVIFKTNGKEKLCMRAFPYEVIESYKDNKFECEGATFELDIDYYIEKQIVASVVRILEIFNISKGEFYEPPEKKKKKK